MAPVSEELELSPHTEVHTTSVSDEVIKTKPAILGSTGLEDS